MTRRRRVAVSIAVLAAACIVARPAPAQQPEPYRDPPFTCEVIDYGTAPPQLPAPADDPLCVRYDKSNITVSDLGVVDFLAAEPGRVGLVAGKCSYWQQDHWVVRLTPGSVPLIEWHGSYWYDGRSGTGGGILAGLRVGGNPVDGHAFVEAVRPLVGDETADDLRRFAADGGGGGASFAFPSGFGDDVCPTRGAPVPPPPAARPAPQAPGGAELAGRAPGGDPLPATGGRAPSFGGMAAAAALLVLGAAVGHMCQLLPPEASGQRRRRVRGPVGAPSAASNTAATSGP